MARTCGYGEGWPLILPCSLPSGHRGVHAWSRTDEPTADEVREYRLDATDPENARLNREEWEAHRNARH